MRILGRELPGRVVVAGVGCLGRRDDGCGPMLARQLAALTSVCALDCGDRLEDFTGDIARERPGTVLVADAVDMGTSPGAVALMGALDVPCGSIDTHRASLGTVMEYLESRTGAVVLLLGIQPAVVSEGYELSPQVTSSVEHLVSVFRACGQSDGQSIEEMPGLAGSVHES